MPPTSPAPTPSAAEPARAGRAGRELQHPRLPRRPPPRRPQSCAPSTPTCCACRRCRGGCSAAGGWRGSPPPAGCTGPAATGGAAARPCSPPTGCASLGSEHLRLPVRWPDRTRGYAVVRVALPGGGELTAVSVHLSLKADERVTPHRADPRGDRRPRAARARRATSTRTTPAGPGGSSTCPTGCGWCRRSGRPTRRGRRAAGSTSCSRHPSCGCCRTARCSVPDAVYAAASDHRPTWVDLDLT